MQEVSKTQYITPSATSLPTPLVVSTPVNGVSFSSYSVAGVHRRPYSDAVDEGAVPRIPVQPISYGDAVHFMSQLTDHTPPDNWVGGLNIEYRIAQSAENDKYSYIIIRKTRQLH